MWWDAPFVHERSGAAAPQLVGLSPAAIPTKVESNNPRPPLSIELLKARQGAIIWQFEQMGKPAPFLWDGAGGTVLQICAKLGLNPNGSARQSVINVLERHLAGLPLTAHGGGKKPKLTRGESLVAADCLRRGIGRDQAAFVVSDWRESKGLASADAKVSGKSVRTGFKSLGGVTQRRGTVGTGNRDPDSKWATSRLAQMHQIKEQLIIPASTEQAASIRKTFRVEGSSTSITSQLDDPLHIIDKGCKVQVSGSWWPDQPDDIKKKKFGCEICGYTQSFTFEYGKVAPAYIILHEEGYYGMPATDMLKLLPAKLRRSVQVNASNFPRIPLESILWTDEKHKPVQLSSHASKYEHRVPRAPNSDLYLPIEKGGQLPPRNPGLKAKYTGDGGRFCFGVMMKRGATGRFEGVKMRPFNYSQTWLVGVKAYQERERAEIARVADFQKAGWGKAGLGIAAATPKRPGGRYQVRYPTTWREELTRACARSVSYPNLRAVTCVTALIDHLLAEGKRLFQDTLFANSFVLFHDALKEFWEKGAQEYLREKHKFGLDRLICIQGDTNDKVAAHYKGRLVGDTPELCPLDTNLFSDFETAMSQNLGHTDTLPHSDPEKFLVGTPAEVQKTMLRSWEQAPTSERIVQDIMRVPRAIDDIIAHHGAKVPHLDNRKGRRRTVKRHIPPPCPTADEINRLKFRRMDPV